MKVRVLGCSGAIAAGCRTTAFLIDDDVLVDAGTGVGDLSLEEMARIEHILVTHSHLDHIVGIPLLADAVMGRRRAPITVHALPETLAALQRHVMNWVIWPDFTQLPSKAEPLLRLAPVRVGQQLELGGKRIEVLPAEHTVPAVGYGIETPQGWWVYTGDTGPNPGLWPLLAQRPVAMLVIETAFSDREAEVALLSQHLAPSALAEELRALDPRVPVYITHMKPGEQAQVTSELAALDSHRIAALEAGQVYEL
ncbi:MBL fold metallo-hydrolase [Caldimonas aquatica]|uniref:3',5'-cyclic-nucleotide phosphodiesterase n=1 Tax=Caldimonas aquatica TaxID=376175 RepID=A0ABY6MSX5_9BURK|nr:3',5'-cyclic-nucleotide phosphodiesterase [Schlegelella aquatica]UZD55111.1 3',5'-cyclic-nucleotide phosphodiesterase [Schlegelella aquatica]